MVNRSKGSPPDTGHGRNGEAALSAREAAERLGVHERTIRRAISSGELVASKLGGQFRITPDALTQFQERHRGVVSSPSRRRAHSAFRPRLAATPALRLIDASPRRLVPAPLPRPLDPLIGRAHELAMLCDLLRQPRSRLLTITGPGGIGKTRLALAAAAAMEAEFADGAAFVALAAISDPALILPTVAHVLEIRERRGRLVKSTLLAALRDRHLLLVLDNVEHLAGEGALAEVAELSHACPKVTLLTTSRAPMRLHHERLFVTPPLALPPAQSARDPVTLASYGAVALFAERAHKVQPGFVLSADNAAAVAEICRHLDGLPLAIELAAAWTRVLLPAALLARLDPRLPLLRGGAHDQPYRLRSMRDAIGWSYDLLGDDEQELFRRLAIFVGGFTLEAAEWLMRGEWEDAGALRTGLPPDTLDLLARLVDKNLVQHHATGGSEPRFTMLETVREFGLEQLVAHGQMDMIEAARAAYVLALAERADPELSGAQQAIWFDRLEAEHPNLRAVLSGFLAMGDGERGLRLANAMTWFWSSRGYFREARGWLEAFLVMPTSVATHARGLVEAANILHWQGDEEQAARCAAESLAICQTHGDQLNAAVALRRLASIAIDQQAFDRAAAFLAESGEIVRSVGSAWDAAFAVFLTGRLARAAGRSGEAVNRFAEASEAFGAIGDRGYVAAALGQQGAALIDTGDLAAAAAAYGTSLELASELKDHTWVAWALVGAAQLAHLSTKPDTAARFLSAASRIRESIGERRLPNSALTSELKSTLGEDRFASEWTRGEQMPGAEVVAEARAILNGRHARQPDLATESPKQAALSRREQQVLALLLADRSDRDIGTTLYISRRTASNHVRAILRKLQVNTRADAVACAVRDALI